MGYLTINFKHLYIKRQKTEEIFETFRTHIGLTSLWHKEYTKKYIRISKYPLDSCAKNTNRQFTKEETKMPNTP